MPAKVTPGPRLRPVIADPRPPRPVAAGRACATELTEHTTIHWHAGSGCPTRRDGVPYLTQDPVFPDKEFTYEFRPPDTGTFFFHPHCDNHQPARRGPGRRADRRRRRDPAVSTPIWSALYRDWRIQDDGDFGVMTTPKGAAARRERSAASRPSTIGISRFSRVPANGDIRGQVPECRHDPDRRSRRREHKGLDDRDGWQCAGPPRRSIRGGWGPAHAARRRLPRGR